MIKFHNSKSGKIAELLPDSAGISGTDDLLQLMADVGYTHSVQRIILHSISLPSGFFDLKTGIAGEILQKFSNYMIKLAIVGDFSEIKSKNLRDFIRESNTRKIISFVSTVEEAVSVLNK